VRLGFGFDRRRRPADAELSLPSHLAIIRISSSLSKAMHIKAPSAGLSDQHIEPLDRSFEPQFAPSLNGKAKPLGSLGRLEDLASSSADLHPLAPRTSAAAVFVFAADHGLAAEGVSLYPASVTRGWSRPILPTRRRQRAREGVRR